MTKTKLAAAAAAVAMVAAADPFEVALWRGETAMVRVPDYTELGEAPAGIGVKVGVLKPVKYLTHVYRLQRSECFDRVEWNSKNVDGPRVAEISVPSDAKPGMYACGLMDIRVVDRVMPPAKEWKYHLDLWQHPWASARVAGVRPFSPAHYAAMRPLWELLATAGQNAITTTLLDQPWNHQCRDAYGSMVGRVKNADGSWRFDYSVFDEYVEFCRGCGIGPRIECFTMCPWGNKVSWQDADGRTVKVSAPPGSREFEEFWGPFLADFAAHLREKGWFGDASIAMDERPPKDVKIIADFVQRHAPGMKISLAGNKNPSEFVGITIDSYCQFIEHIDAKFLAEAAERRQKGFVTTYYVCCGPEFPNTFLDSKPEEGFWVGVYPAMSGLDGFCRWAYNSWGEDPMHDGSFRDWHAGDTYFAYPDGSPSIRFLELRNGIVAAEKLRILREQGLFADEIAALARRFDHREAIANRSDFRKLRADTLKLVNKEVAQ